ncbi:uncharacterized protein LOC9649751 [Selaginella moellendorffii]|uniref:uncharacterized protein LOC9649751 n=1 Tax=Selaginella moellendorffii TaxID=88036 RepID=UPI000D1CD7ED|nr:uncharacterized protein LOC9649751 [Selaginella moellendorffii]|eukprot:XP_024537388.1 uncharacterized protein LOC9649751 [Selaginella moellendorffii]
MGGLCSKTVPEDSSGSSEGTRPNFKRQLSKPSQQPNGVNGIYAAGKAPAPDPSTSVDKVASSSPETDDTKDDEEDKSERIKLSRVLSHKARNAKSILGRAGTAGLDKAVVMLDTFGSSITTTIGSGFAAGVAPKGNKIGILAFEVANTVVKGYSLKQSLSEESLQLLKKEILPSEGVQRLVSKDLDELWRIAASDKRHELKVFASEVVRFGNHCRAPEWHQLDRLINRLGTEVQIPRQSPEHAEQEMQELMTLAQNTAELYHELHALDRYDNDVRRKIEENELSSNPHKGESLAMLKSDFKCQQKHVKLLQKKSLWSKIMEELMEKLLDIVYFLHQQIADAFGEYDEEQSMKLSSVPRLGALGLALHYANIINQIDTLVSRPSSIPPNTRDNLYQGLPPSIKMSLRSALYAAANSNKEELTASQIKEEMEKILVWMVPIASNTTKAHHGFGWVGEWASAGSSIDRKPYVQEISLIQTLHHADQEVTEKYILDLLVWLNLLISRAKSNLNGHNRSPHKSPFRSPVKKTIVLNPLPPPATSSRELSKEDQEMLTGAVLRRLTPGISKSQEFTKKPKVLSTRLSKSHSHSPLPCTVKPETSTPFTSRRSLRPLELELERIRALDKIDRVDTLTGAPAAATA